MKIAATGDIHYDLLDSGDKKKLFFLFLEKLKAEEADALIIAGDVVGLGWNKLEEGLEWFRPAAPVRMMVFGNHEHWAADKNTARHLRRMEKIIEGCGFHMLEREPFQLGRVGFAGNCGWYDYSFAEGTEFPGADFKTKTIMGRVVWNDAVFVGLDRSDRAYTDELTAKLEQDIRDLETRVETIVAVTHHLAFREMLTQKPGNSLWVFANAFMGSDRLGEMLLAHPKVKLHICGHSHRPCRIQIEHLESVNPGSTYNEKKYAVLKV